MNPDTELPYHSDDLSLPGSSLPATHVGSDKIVLTEADTDRIIEMAWEDRTTFDAIFFQFGLQESDVKALMKSRLKFSSYKLWRKRVEACKTKHSLTRVDGITRFRSKLQRAISSNKISKRRGKY